MAYTLRSPRESEIVCIQFYLQYQLLNEQMKLAVTHVYWEGIGTGLCREADHTHLQSR